MPVYDITIDENNALTIGECTLYIKEFKSPTQFLLAIDAPKSVEINRKERLDMQGKAKCAAAETRIKKATKDKE